MAAVRELAERELPQVRVGIAPPDGDELVHGLDPTTRYALGNALALMGDTAQAIVQLREAVRLAAAARDDKLAAEIRQRLERYRR